jgi:membrane associated rhomboid family serine protease
MGIENRDYYRQAHASGPWADWGLYSLTPVVKFLIITNVVVFVLQILVVREARVSPLDVMRSRDPELDRLLTEAENDPEARAQLKRKHPELDAMLDAKDEQSPLVPGQRVSVLQEWFQLDTRKVIQHWQVWRLVTHAFCHDRYGIFHIFFNMLFLYWFGCTLEAMYGSREFLLFYLAAAVVAGLAFVGLDLHTGSTTPGIGASGAVMAVAMLYALHFPRETFYIFWAIHVEMRWLILFYVIWDLHPVLLALSGDRFHSGIAHAAHLGGLAFGFAYGWYQWRLEPLRAWIPPWRRTRSRGPRPVVAWEPRPAPAPDADMQRVDRLLQKIHESGKESLSDEERAFLDHASERMRNRRNRRR